MLGWLIAFIQLLGLVTAARAIMEARTAQGAVAWASPGRIGGEPRESADRDEGKREEDTHETPGRAQPYGQCRTKKGKVDMPGDGENAPAVRNFAKSGKDLISARHGSIAATPGSSPGDAAQAGEQNQGR